MIYDDDDDDDDRDDADEWVPRNQEGYSVVVVVIVIETLTNG